MVDQKRGNIAVLSPLQGCDRALCPDDRTNVLIGLTDKKAFSTRAC